MRLYTSSSTGNNSTGSPLLREHASTQRSTTFCLTAAAVLAGILPSIISAQPLPCYRMGYATIGENFLYVQGGHTSSAGGTNIATNQMFSLDLTVSWSADSPVWRDVRPTNSPTVAWHSLAVTKAQDQLFMWDSTSGGSFSTFTLQTSIWSPNASIPNGFKVNGLRSAANEITGEIVVPGALAQGQQSFLVTLPMATNTSYQTSNMPADVPDPLVHYAFAWSASLSGMLLYGGHTSNGNQANPVLRQYRNGAWNTLETSGTSPGDVSSHCMIPAYNGTIMVVFGGCNVAQVSQSAIFFLDVQTMRWTEGTIAAPQNARCNMACTVRGDYFIAWGGNINATGVADGKPLIYNIKDKKWVEQYLPTSPTIIPGVGPNPSNPVSPTSPPSSGPNGAVIGGGVAGGAVILNLLMFFFYRRRKHVNVKNGSESSETPLDASSSARGAAASAHSDIESSPYPPNQPWSSASPPPPPALRPRPVSHQQQQHEYISMEPIIQAEPIAFPNYTNHRDSFLRNPQGQALQFDDTGIDGKEPFAYGDNDINNKSNHRNSAFWGPRNPQEYSPQQTKKSNDPQYKPHSPTEISYDFVEYPQRLNDPQGDGTNASVIRSNGGGGNSGVEGLDLRQQIAYIQAQNQDIERMRMEQQELLRKLQEQLDAQGKSA